MNKLIKKLIDERRVTLFLALVIAVLGAFCYYILPRQENPDVTAPYAMIVTVYPGGSPEDVKELVTTKIEDELSELDNFDESQGISKEGLSIVVAKFETNADPSRALQDTRNAVNDVQGDLPESVYPSEVRTDLTETAGIIISLSGEEYSYEQLASFGELFKDKLMDIEGISKFNIEGDLDKEVKVDIDIAKLNQLNLSIMDIKNLLSAQNIEIPSGSIEYDDHKITVKTPGIFTSVDDIRNVIIGISPDTGVVTKLSDVADVYMDIEEGDEKFKQNGENAVLLTGYFKKSKNVVLVGKDVRKAIDEVKSELPADLVVEEIVYQPDDVSKSVNDFMGSLLMGIILVIVVVFIGMGLRNALVVSAAIPLSVLMTFGVMYLMKIQIHQMSLTALIVALGVLVDNAIVISDTVQVRIDQHGEDRITAAFNGTKMSALPIFTATLTTIAAFSPLLGLPGTAGKFLVSIPLVLIISIISAYIVAMFVTPSMAASLFKPSKVKTHKQNRVRVFFKNSLSKALEHKLVTVGAVVIVFLLTMNMVMPRLQSQFFPNTDKNLFYVEMTTELSGDIKASERLSDQVNHILSDIPEIKSSTVAVGSGLPKFYISMMPATPSTDYAQMLCKFELGDKKTRRFESNEAFIDYIQVLLDENISGGKVSAKLLVNAIPSDAKVIIKVSGNNSERLKEVADDLKEAVSKVPGTLNVRHDMKDMSLQLEVDIDKDKASSFGLNQYDIQSQINIALYGSNASVYRRNGNEYNIYLKSTVDSVEMLENLEIKSSTTGHKIPLRQFAKVTYGSKIDEINTLNSRQTITILANEALGYSPTELENIIETEVLPTIDTSGTTIVFAGEREDIAENFSVVGILAILAVFIIYLILLVQFNSFAQPLVILITIPLSLIGSILGLYLFNSALSLTAFLGIIALIGLVVKNGILLIEYINDARNQGLSIEDACMDAVDKRFNAIILSAATTVMGLIPLAMSGSRLFGPMAIALMSGLTVSTFLTMVVVPVFYSIIENLILKHKLKSKKTVL